MSDPKLTPNLFQRDAEWINPLEIIEPLRKNLWVVLLIIAACFLLAIFYNLYATPIYLAKSSVIVRQDIPDNLLREKEATTVKWADPKSELKTKERMITSQTLIQDLVKRLIEKGYYAAELKRSNYSRQKPEVQAAVIENLAGRTKGGIMVANLRDTNIIEIRYQSANAALAQDLVNLLADITVEFHNSEQLLILKDSLSYLNQQLDEARLRVEEAESKLYEYRRKHNIFETDMDKELIGQRRAELEEKLTNVVELRKELESRKNQLENLLQRQDYLKYTDMVPDNDVLLKLKQDLVETEVNHQKLQIKYGDKHPEVARTGKEIEILKRKFEQELAVAINRLQYDLNVAKARQEFLETALAEFETSAVASTQKDIEYVVLDRDANSAREIYRTLLGAVKEVTVNTNSIRSNVVYVGERATRPTAPIRPNKRMNIIMGLLMGLLMGALFAYGREYLDQSIRTPSDVTKAVKLPVLCTVPLYNIKKVQQNPKPERMLMVGQRPKSLFSESIINLRSQLGIKLPQDSPKAILVTSCAPQEGKSLIAANLALSLAMNGQRTLLVDADLHHPVVHKIFNIDRHDPGLYDLIVETLNPQWSSLDLQTMSLGDIQHLIQLKQWSGTIKIKWDSVPDLLTISFQEGKPAGSNLKGWKESIQSANGFPLPKNVSFSLDNSEISLLDNEHQSGLQAVAFLHQYPALCRSSYFADMIVEQYVMDAGHSNLQTLVAGTQPKNPSEVLGSEQMKILLSLLKERFDRVVIDAPPAWPLSDVSVLSPMIDWILWICRSGAIPRNTFQHAIHQIQQVQPNIIGVVINAVDMQRDRYYYYGYPKYYYNRYYRSSYYLESSEGAEANESEGSES